MNEKTAQKAADIMNAIKEVSESIEALELPAEEKIETDNVIIRLNVNERRHAQVIIQNVDGMLEEALIAPIMTGLKAYRDELKKALKALK